jgi:GTP-binding protein
VAEKGEPGRTRRLQLELRLIADVGIIGVPNAGKSTLLSVLTRAHPKIADYPFTTLEPNLGVLEFDDGGTLVLADIPGLIEGAHAGAGLGDAFLRHIQRTRVLVHLLDGMAEDPLADYAQINGEMALFDKDLRGKPQIVVVNKLDVPQVRQRWPELQAALKAVGVPSRAISALARKGTRELANEVRRVAASTPAPQPAETMPIYRREARLDDFTVSSEGPRMWRVAGEPLERAAAMTYWELEESVRRYQRLLRRLGVEDALRAAGAQPGDSVRIAEYELEWQD